MKCTKGGLHLWLGRGRCVFERPVDVLDVQGESQLVRRGYVQWEEDETFQREGTALEELLDGEGIRKEIDYKNFPQFFRPLKETNKIRAERGR